MGGEFWNRWLWIMNLPVSFRGLWTHPFHGNPVLNQSVWRDDTQIWGLPTGVVIPFPLITKIVNGVYFGYLPPRVCLKILNPNGHALEVWYPPSETNRTCFSRLGYDPQQNAELTEKYGGGLARNRSWNRKILGILASEVPLNHMLNGTQIFLPLRRRG